MPDFSEFFFTLQSYGFYEFFLPFLLIFSIVFAILQKIRVLGDKKGVHIVVALAVGLLAIQNSFVVFLINNFLTNIALVIILIIMFLVILGLLAGDQVGAAKINWIIMVVALVGIFWALFYDFFAGTWVLPQLFTMNSSSQGSLLTILIFVVVIYMVVGGFGGEKSKDAGPLFELKGRP